MLDVREITKHRGRRTLWERLSFSVAPGEQLAITGPSGSGKSTLLDCIGQIEAVDGGSISIEGTVGGRSRGSARRLRREVLGYLFQDFGLVPDMTVEENLRLSSPGRTGRASRCAEALERVGLPDVARHRAHELSGGEQQRVALARLILKRPRLIVADEPTSALDHTNGQVVLDLLEEFATAGAAIVIATHSDAVRRTADRELSLGDSGAGGTQCS